MKTVDFANSAFSNRSALILYSSVNSKGRRDATGAFIPEAKKLERFLEQEVGMRCFKLPIETGKRGTSRLQVAEAFGRVEAAFERVSVVAMFCHGWPTGIQFGWNIKNIAEELGRVDHLLSNDVVFILYACLTADSGSRRYLSEPKAGCDGGFADTLRDELAVKGKIFARVVAHRTAGHTTKNPYALFFEASGESKRCSGGEWIVEPRSAQWSKWVKLLKTDFRFAFPLLTLQEIKDCLI